MRRKAGGGLGTGWTVAVDVRADRDGGDRVSAARRIYMGIGALLAAGAGGCGLERSQVGLANQAGSGWAGRWWGENTGKGAVLGCWGPVEAGVGSVCMANEACEALAKGHGGWGWSETGLSGMQVGPEGQIRTWNGAAVVQAGSGSCSYGRGRSG